MNWLSSPKVRLALIVNGLYFISLLAPHAVPTRPRPFVRLGDGYAATAPPPPPPAPVKRHVTLAPLPPLTAPVKATTYVSKQFDQLDVYLTSDLTLVDRPDHRLLLSPTFTTKASKPEMPDSVLLRFVSYSSERTLSPSTPVSITADGKYLIDERTRFWYNGNAVPPADGAPVVEGVGVELPYDLFLDIAYGDRVIVQFGPDRVQLTGDQIAAFRDMHRRLPPPEGLNESGSGGPVIIQASPDVVRSN